MRVVARNAHLFISRDITNTLVIAAATAVVVICLVPIRDSESELGRLPPARQQHRRAVPSSPGNPRRPVIANHGKQHVCARCSENCTPGARTGRDLQSILFLRQSKCGCACGTGRPVGNDWNPVIDKSEYPISVMG